MAGTGELSYVIEREKRTYDKSVVAIFHNPFENHHKFQRFGDEVDVEKLKRSYGSRRSKVCDFPSKRRQETLDILTDGELLLYHGEAPSLLTVYFLSHGDIDDLIYTEELLDKNGTYEHFTKAEVYECLKKCEKLKNTNFHIFFGACRGEDDEAFVQPGQDKRVKLPKNSCRLQSQPNDQRFFVFHATTEGSPARRLPREGTRLVCAATHVLDRQEMDLDVMRFATRIQNAMRDKAKETMEGQTGEWINFSNCNRYISKSPFIENKAITSARRDFYSWTPFVAKIALVFSSASNDTGELKSNLEDLGFAVKTFSIRDMKNQLEKFAKSCEERKYPTCLMVFAFTKISESNQELMIIDGTTAIQDVTRMFVSSEAPSLLEDPKIFFFLDDLQMPEADFHQARSSSGESNHSNFLRVVAIGKEMVDNVIASLVSSELRKGRSLQRLLGSVLHNTTPDVSSKLYSQVYSTLPFCLDFPIHEDVYIRPQISIVNRKVEVDFDVIVSEISYSVSNEREESKFWTLVSPSGMGKTLCVKELCTVLSEKLPEYIVHILNIEIDLDQNVEDIIQDSLGTKKPSDFGQKITGRKVLLFIDGIDEVWEEYSDSLIGMFQFLMDLKLHCVISGRPDEMDLVKKSLDNCKLTELQLISFKWDERVQLIQNLTGLNENDARLKLESFQKRSNREVTENTLHLSILAKTLNSDFFLDNISLIYKNYISQSVKLALVKFDALDENNTFIFEDEVNKKLKLLTIAALKSRAAKFYSDDLSIELRDQIMKTGLVKSSSHSLALVHTTYSEFLISWALLEPPHALSLSIRRKELFKEIMESTGYGQVRRFLNEHLADRNLLVRYNQQWEKSRDFMTVICEEGLYNIFKFVFNTCEDIAKQEWFQTSKQDYLYKACLSNEHLAMELINGGANVTEMAKKIFKQLETFIVDIANRGFSEILSNIDSTEALRVISFEPSRIDKVAPKYFSKQTIIEDYEEFKNWIAIRDHPLKLALKNGHEKCAVYLINLFSNSTDNFHRLIGSEANVKTVVSMAILNKRKLLLDSTVYFEMEIDHYLRANQDGILVQILNGGTVLNFSIEHNDLDLIEPLIKYLGVNLQHSNKFGQNVLHLAALKKGSLETVKYLLNVGCDIRAETNEGRNSFFLSLSNPDAEISRLLFDADLPIYDSDGTSALHYAAKFSAPKIKFLLHLHPMFKQIVNGTDSEGRTALYICAEQGDSGGVLVLINAGADINIATKTGKTALHIAILNEHLNVVDLLLSQQNLQINIASHDKNTELHFACEKGLDQVAFELLALGADKNAINDLGETPAQTADWNGMFELSEKVNAFSSTFENVDHFDSHDIEKAAMVGDLQFLQQLSSEEKHELSSDVVLKSLFKALQAGENEFFKMLLDMFPDMINETSDGMHLIHVACACGNIRGLKILIDMRSPVNVTDRFGKTPLCYAAKKLAKKNNEEMLTCLLNVPGIDVNSKLESRTTVLHQAVNSRNRELVEKIINLGANLNALGRVGEDPLYWACMNEDLAMVQLLLRAGSKPPFENRFDNSPLYKALHEGYFEISEELIRHGANVNILTNEGLSLLQFLLFEKKMAAAEWLILKDGIDLNHKISNMSVVGVAAQVGNLKVLTTLWQKGAHFRDQDLALFYAVKCNHAGCVKYLLEKKIFDVNRRLYGDLTYLLVACRNGNLEITKMLVDNGANIYLQNSHGIGPLFAAIENSTDIVKYLLHIDGNLIYTELNGNKPIHTAATKNAGAAKLLMDVYKCDPLINNSAGNSPLHIAVMNGNVECVKLLSKTVKKRGVNKKSISGYSVLHTAIFRGSIEMTSILLSEGADPNVLYTQDNPTMRNQPLIFYAFSMGNREIIKTLLQHPTIDVSKDSNKKNLVEYVVEMNNALFVRILVNARVDQKVLGYSLFIRAFTTDNHEMINMFLESPEEIDVNISDENGQTALFYAVDMRSNALVEKLLQRGADPTSSNVVGTTPLHAAVDSGDLKLVRALIHQETINKKEETTGSTPLILAVDKNQLQTVKLLCESGADVNIADNSKMSPLMRAISKKFNAIALFLLNHTCVDVDKVASDGKTALHIAIQNGDVEVVKKLLAKNANVLIPRWLEGTAVHCAAGFEEVEILELLARKDPTCVNFSCNVGTPFFFAIENARLESVKTLLSLNLDFQAVNENGENALHFAVKVGALNVVEYFLEMNLFDLESTTFRGYTSLHLAAQKGHYKVTQRLVELGANLKATNREGLTATHLAAANGQGHVIMLFKDDSLASLKCHNGNTPLHLARDLNSVVSLIKMKADINVQNKEGETPLMRAVMFWDDERFVKYLTKGPVNLELCNNNGETALFLAAKKSRMIIFQLLLDHGANVDVTNNDGLSIASLMESML